MARFHCSCSRITHGTIQHKSKHRVLLLRKDKKTPLLWQVLSNKYEGRLEFAARNDRKGKSSVALGLEAGDKKESKVILYPAGSSSFVRYEGLSNIFHLVISF